MKIQSMILSAIFTVLIVLVGVKICLVTIHKFEEPWDIPVENVYDEFDISSTGIISAYSDLAIDFTTYTPPTNITFIHPDGREAVIDFGGETITYSGELSVEESARLFFEAYGNLCGK